MTNPSFGAAVSDCRDIGSIAKVVKRQGFWRLSKFFQKFRAHLGAQQKSRQFKALAPLRVDLRPPPSHARTMERRLYLFRHGETAWNLQRRLQGTNDIPLNETGRQQADALLPFFQKTPVQAWFSSPLQRAQETMLRACQPPADAVKLIPELGEVHLGVLEGLHEAEMDARFPEDQIQRWRGFHDLDFAFDGAESANASNARFDRALEEILSHDFEAAAVCSHGFLLKRYLHKTKPRPAGFRVPNAVIFTLVWNSETGMFYEL